jgi:hypothetical protein
MVRKANKVADIMTLPKTILYPAAFQRSPPAQFDGVFNWEAIHMREGENAFPRGIRPMDIDAAIEIDWHHILFETKDEGVEVPLSQMQSLLSLVASQRVTLICLWGKTTPTSWAVWSRDPLVRPLVVLTGGRVIDAPLMPLMSGRRPMIGVGDLAYFNRRSCTASDVFDFLKMWSIAISACERIR